MILTNIRLFTDDFPACFKFYQDAIGLVPTWGTADESYATFQLANEVSLSLLKKHPAPNSDPKTEGSIFNDQAIMIFGVHDLQKTSDKLRKQGVKFVREPHDAPGMGIRVAHIRDPAGNLIEIYSDLPKEK